MVSQDANFRLKSRLRPSTHEDPWLAPGMAYFVDNVPYDEHVLKHATQEDVSGAFEAAFVLFLPLS